MTTLSRSFAILDLFAPARMVWSVEDIAAELGYSTPTTYRYVRDLAATGLLVRFGNGTYSLGSRIVELDLLIRRADPLLNVGLPIVQDLVAQAGCDINLIGLYGSRIVTIHQERGQEKLPLSFGRGRLMPPLRGAGAKIISAYLPRAQLKRLYENNRDDARAYGLGDDWRAFSTAMARFRHDGYSVSLGELDPGFFGIAAPIFGPSDRILGSMVAALSQRRQQLSRQEKIADLLKGGAERVTKALARLDRSATREIDPPAGAESPSPQRRGSKA